MVVHRIHACVSMCACAHACARGIPHLPGRQPLRPLPGAGSGTLGGLTMCSDPRAPCPELGQAQPCGVLTRVWHCGEAATRGHCCRLVLAAPRVDSCRGGCGGTSVHSVRWATGSWSPEWGPAPPASTLGAGAVPDAREALGPVDLAVTLCVFCARAGSSCCPTCSAAPSRGV